MGFSAWQSRAAQCLIYKSIWELGIRFLKVISHPGDVPNPPAPTFLFNMSEGAPGWSWSLQGAHKYWQGSDSFFFFLSWKTRPLGHQTPLEVQEKLSSIQLCRVYPKIHWIGKIRGDLALGCSESHESKIYPFNLTVPIPMSTSGKNRDCLSPAEPKTGLGPHFLRRQRYYHPWKGI